MALIGSIDTFNPKADNWILYQEQLEQFFVVNNIKQEEGSDRRISALLSLIRADTYRVLRDLCTPRKPSEKSYAELCELLKIQCSPPTCVFRERIEFYEAKQEESESINNWYARIHNLSSNCEFGTQLQQILIDKFICGLKPGTIRDRLCEEKKNVRLEKLLEIALSKEATIHAENKDVGDVLNPSGRHYNKKTNSNQRAENENTSKYKPETPNGKWLCSRCGNMYTGSQTCSYFRTTDRSPVIATEDLAEKTEAYTTKFWAEIFGSFNIGCSFLISLILQSVRFFLYSILRPLTVGLIQLISDYFFKPILTTLFNAVIQPVLIFFYNIVTSLRDICDPLAEAIGYFIREIAVLIRAFRIIEVNTNGGEKMCNRKVNKNSKFINRNKNDIDFHENKV